MFRRTCLVLVCFATAGVAAAQVPQSERDALIALYVATGGASWTADTNWRNLDDTGFNDPGTECTWFGVVCAAGTNVTHLDLGQNGLAGTLPSEIGDFPALEKLILEKNDLDGGLPAQFGDLSNLRELDLYLNRLDGAIPFQLWDLANLEILDLSANYLTGGIPAAISGLTSLTELSLGANDLGGSIPSEVGDLVNLRKLWIGYNGFVGEIPPEIGNLVQLESLDLNSNTLRGTIPAGIWNLTNLISLDLSGNELEGTLPHQIGNLTSLFWLDLRSNRLSGAIPSAIGDLTALGELALEGNMFSGEVPIEIANLLNLTPFTTDLGHNALWTDDPDVQYFLDVYDPWWDETQTLAPEGLSVASVSDHTVWFEWTPILYTGDEGGYEIVAFQSGEPVSLGFTLTKSDTTFPVTGLQPGEGVFVGVRAFTRPHRMETAYYQKNLLVSNILSWDGGGTTDTGCAAPAIQMSGDHPFILEASAHETWLWNTGETTQTIEVSPHWPAWYWVKTTDAGGCTDAAAVFVGEDLLFADGFESGDRDYWVE